MYFLFLKIFWIMFSFLSYFIVSTLLYFIGPNCSVQVQASEDPSCEDRPLSSHKQPLHGLSCESEEQDRDFWFLVWYVRGLEVTTLLNNE